MWRTAAFLLFFGLALPSALTSGSKLVSRRSSARSPRQIAASVGAASYEEFSSSGSLESSESKRVARKLASPPLDVSEQEQQDVEYAVYQGVMGRPGLDFPVFPAIPRTSFKCVRGGGGYYADLDTGCQVFHICDGGRKISFLCPNGTVFKQQDLICDWWFKVDCISSPGFYKDSEEHLAKERKQPTTTETNYETRYTARPEQHRLDVASREYDAEHSYDSYGQPISNTKASKPNRKTNRDGGNNKSKYANSRQYSSYEYANSDEPVDNAEERIDEAREQKSLDADRPAGRKTQIESQLVAETASFASNNRNGFGYNQNPNGYSTRKVAAGDINYPKPFEKNPVRKTPPSTQSTFGENYSDYRETVPRFSSRSDNFQDNSYSRFVQSTATSKRSDRIETTTRPTRTSTVPTTYVTAPVSEHALDMLKTLKDLEFDQIEPTTDAEKYLGGQRLGLNIPPSSGPDTLRTLAMYFASAVDSYVTKLPEPTVDVEKNQTESSFAPEDGEDVLSSALLSKGTLDKYTQLFSGSKNESSAEGSEYAPKNDSEIKIRERNDLESQQSRGPLSRVTGTQQIRELAQVFTHALSAYLQDPETFRRVLAEIRPTEPPSLRSNDIETTFLTGAGTTSVTTSGNEEEILDFSDVTKSTRLDSLTSEYYTTEMSYTTRAGTPTTPIPLVLLNSNSLNADRTPGSRYITGNAEKTASQSRESKQIKNDEPSPSLLPIIVPDSTYNDSDIDYFPSLCNNTNITEVNSYGFDVKHENSTPITTALDSTLADIGAIPANWGDILSTRNSAQPEAPALPSVDLIPPHVRNDTDLPITIPSDEILPPLSNKLSDNTESLQRAQSQSFISRSNALDRDSKSPSTTLATAPSVRSISTTAGTISETVTEIVEDSTTRIPERYMSTIQSLWTTSTTVGDLWKSTIFLDPLTINQELSANVDEKKATPSSHTYLPRFTKDRSSQTTNSLDDDITRVTEANKPTTLSQTSDITDTLTTISDQETTNYAHNTESVLTTIADTEPTPYFETGTTPQIAEETTTDILSTVLSTIDRLPSTVPSEYEQHVDSIGSRFQISTDLSETEFGTRINAETTPTIVKRVTSSMSSSSSTENRRGKSLSISATTPTPREASREDFVNAMQQRANEMFGNLNASTVNTLMNVMKQADSNTTVRRLILLLVQTCNEDVNKTVEASRAALLDALISTPMGSDEQEVESRIGSSEDAQNTNRLNPETLQAQESINIAPRRGKNIQFSGRNRIAESTSKRAEYTSTTITVDQSETSTSTDTTGLPSTTLSPSAITTVDSNPTTFSTTIITTSNTDLTTLSAATTEYTTESETTTTSSDTTTVETTPQQFSISTFSTFKTVPRSISTQSVSSKTDQPFSVSSLPYEINSLSSDEVSSAHSTVAPPITTYRSKSHNKFTITPIDSGSGEAANNVGLNEQKDSDGRALELLRSLYSLAAKWGG